MMSTTLSARFVRNPTRHHVCSWCCKWITGPYIRLYGMADREKPWTLRLHPTEACCPSAVRDAKIAAALDQARAATPDLTVTAATAVSGDGGPQ